ncbi:MAG: outer membrane protein TolC, partial [Kiritimatiellia bacterium]
LTILSLRRRVMAIAGAEVTVEPESMGPPVGSDIDVKVMGDDFDTVGEVAQRLKRLIADVQGVADVTDNYRVNRPEMALRIDRGAAKSVGVNSGLVGQTVRTAIAGTIATTLRDGEEEHDIVVRLAPEHRQSVQAVMDLRLPGRAERDPDTHMVPISAVATYSLAGGTGSVQHVDQDLTISIKGDVMEGENVNARQVEIQKIIDGFDFPQGYSAKLGGSQKEQQETAAFLMWAMGVALFLIFFVLVAQFNHLIKPFIVLGTVVLSLIGVLWGLLLTGTPFGIMMTGIGVISLAGVVVNNAIVLIDYVGLLEKRGYSVQEALVRAGMTRFRPVMLTAVTTILGLVPMAIGVAVEVYFWGSTVPLPGVKLVVGSPSSSFWGPMAVAMIFGLAFATILTLIMVPTLYSIQEDIMWLIRTAIRGIQGLLGPTKAKAARSGAVASALLLGVGVSVAQPAEAVTLDEAYAAAETNNIDIKMARERTFQAKNQRIMAWTLLQPRVQGQWNWTRNQFDDVTLDFGESTLGPYFVMEELHGLEANSLVDPIRELLPEPTVVQRQQFQDANVTITQPLFNGSALPLLMGAYRQANAASLEERFAVQRVRSGVAQAFYGVVTARKAMELSEQAVELANTQLELATRQVEVGTAAPRSVLQAKLRVSQAQRDVRRGSERLSQAEQAWVNITGLPRDAEIELGTLAAAPESLQAALDTAQVRRLDLQAADVRVDVAKMQTRSDALKWAPTVNYRFSYLWSENAGFVGKNSYWNMGLSATWVLWDGGMRLAEQRNSASQRRMAQLAVEGSKTSIEEEVRVAWRTYEAARSSIEAVDVEVGLAQENLELARRGFEAGSTTFLEVQQAELALENAELNRVVERQSHALSVVGLQAVTGSL